MYSCFCIAQLEVQPMLKTHFGTTFYDHIIMYTSDVHLHAYLICAYYSSSVSWMFHESILAESYIKATWFSKLVLMSNDSWHVGLGVWIIVKGQPLPSICLPPPTVDDLSDQGVVTYVCDQDQESSWLKIILDRLIAPFRGPWFLGLREFKGQNVTTLP